MRSFASSCLVGLMAGCMAVVAAADMAASSDTFNLRGGSSGSSSTAESGVASSERRVEEIESPYTVTPGGAEGIPMCPKNNPCCRFTRNDIEVDEYKYGEVEFEGAMMDLKLKIYRQKGAVGKLPVILHIPGGNFEPYVRDWQHDRRARGMARRGFAVAMIDYRKEDLPEDLTAENFVQLIQPRYYTLLMLPVYDILTAVQWLVSQSEDLGLDTSNMAMFGCDGGAMYASTASIVDMKAEFKELEGAAEHIASTVAIGASVPWGIVTEFQLPLRAGWQIPPYLQVHARDPVFFPYQMALGAQRVLGMLGAAMKQITLEDGNNQFVCDELTRKPGVHGDEQVFFDDLMASGLRTMNVNGCEL